MTVTLFSLTACGQCLAAEKWMKRKGIEYHKVFIDNNEKLRQELLDAGHGTMPVIRAEKAGQKVMEFAGFSDERINQLRNLIFAS